ncbi:MAG: sulfatase [Candidatus Auribacterota bacterium]|nr:sulfatase [Candidatus Auribacterota bacterium]
MKKYLIFILLAGVVSGCGMEAKEREGRNVNVLLISIDSLRPDHLGCYGYERDTSPVMDRLARDGVLFKNTVSSTSWTLPAHISLFTSMDIMVHGVEGDGVSLHQDIGTLAQVLKRDGYRNAAFCSSPYLNPAFGFDRGFDLYHNIDLDDPGFKDTVLPPEEERDAVHDDITSPRITELSLEWLENNSSDPFFLFVHMWDVHYDYIPPAPYDRKFDPDYSGGIDGRRFIHNPSINPEMDPRDLEHIIALYDGEISWVDHHLGLIVEKLKELGVFENTLIVITADHGDEFFEHGGKGHRNTLYDEVVKIPLIIHGPGVAKRGVEVVEQAGIIDIAPTILNLCGLEIPSWMQGEVLLSGPGDQPEQGEGAVLLELGPELKALRTNPYQLIFNLKHLQTIIFDLDRGPGETYQHLVTSPDRWNEANLKFYSRLTADRSLAEKYRGGKTGVPVHLSEEEAARLKSLGYL